nr:hypothetical protein [Brucella anthropi]
MYYNDRPPSPDTDAEKQWRKDEYKRLRSALSLPRVELSAITGLAISTLNQIPYRQKAPSLLVLERMREALEKREAA